MFLSGFALIAICAVCYILDDLLFTLRTARTTWLVKIAAHREDLPELDGDGTDIAQQCNDCLRSGILERAIADRP